MAYTGLQRTLLSKAGEYIRLGYRIGFTRDKVFLDEYIVPTIMTVFGPVQHGEPDAPDDFNGISVIPDGIVCVDFDIPDFGLVWQGALPITWKERTPRGWHLFYSLPKPNKCQPRIKWMEHVDLLCKVGEGVAPKQKKRASIYGGMKEDGSPWGEHVLISPTPGYERRWPDEMPVRNQLPECPFWLLDILEREPPEPKPKPKPVVKPKFGDLEW